MTAEKEIREKIVDKLMNEGRFGRPKCPICGENLYGERMLGGTTYSCTGCDYEEHYD